jgi:hypothetical protein
MLQVGFEPTISVFERAKTVHALDCVATGIGAEFTTSSNISNIFSGINMKKKFYRLKDIKYGKDVN